MGSWEVLIGMGVPNRLGVLINKNTLERGCLFERGRLLEESVIITVMIRFSAFLPRSAPLRVCFCK